MLKTLSLLSTAASSLALCPKSVPLTFGPRQAVLRASADEMIPAAEWDKWSCTGDACGVDYFDEADDGIEVCGVESREVACIDIWDVNGDAFAYEPIDDAPAPAISAEEYWALEAAGPSPARRTRMRERISEDAAPRRPSETADAAPPAGLGRVAQL